MPLFVFASGAVYGLCIHRGKYAKNIDFIVNKIKRLLVPYVVFGFLYVAPVMCLLGLTDRGYMGYCFRGIVLSLDSRHLWFLEALFFIFAFSVTIRKWMLKSNKTRLNVLFLSLIIFAIARYMPDEFQIGKAFSFQLFFVMGALMHFYYEKIAMVVLKLKYIWIILPFVLLGKFFFNPCAVTNLGYQLIGICMVTVVAMLLENWTKLINAKWFQAIKEYSMGIFLFHPMIIYVCYFWLGSKDILPVILSTGIALGSILLSVLFTKIMRKLKLGFLLGE